MGEVEVDPLDEFTESLTKFTKYTSFRPLATLSYASDIYNNSSIVSRCAFTLVFCICSLKKELMYNLMFLNYCLVLFDK